MFPFKDVVDLFTYSYFYINNSSSLCSFWCFTLFMVDVNGTPFYSLFIYFRMSVVQNFPPILILEQHSRHSCPTHNFSKSTWALRLHDRTVI